jgi:CheY-like chemotaxis protein
MNVTPPTILCVDDESSILQLHRMVFESAGYCVLTAKSASQALDIFASQSVNAVVADYWMADMNGLQLAREIRKFNRPVAIIVLSGYDELPCESLGVADAWLRKGEEGPESLLHRLRGLLLSDCA